MPLRDRIEKEFKQALKARDKRRIATLRLIRAAITDREIARRGEGAPPPDEGEILDILAKMMRQRSEAIEDYDRAGRDDLVRQESEERDVIAAFLPRQFSEEETLEVCRALVGELDAKGLKDMGRVMRTLKSRHPRQIDFAQAGKKLREILGRSP